MSAPEIQKQNCYVVLSISQLEHMIQTIREERGPDAPDSATGVFWSRVTRDADGEWQISSARLAFEPLTKQTP